MRRRAIILAISAALTADCSNREGAPRTLKSGKEIRLLFAGVVDNSFFIEYCSDLPLDDRRTLLVEADEVLDGLRSGIARGKVTEAKLSPTTCTWRVRWAGWRPVIVGEETTTFR